MAKTPEEMAQEITTKVADLKGQIEKAATVEDLTAAKNELESFKTSNKEAMDNLITKKEYTKLEDALKEQGEVITELKEKGINETSNISFRESIKNALIENKDVITSMKDNSSAKAKLTVKAVQDMTFATNTTGNVGRVERQTGIESASRRTPILLEIVNTSGTNANLYEWIEKTGHEGGVAMVAEGTVKPQGDWDLELFSQKPKKEAIIVTISKEMLDDIDGMAREVEEEIYEQIRLFTESIVMNGDGVGNNIVGLDANATPYTVGSFADTITNANEFDAIRTGINQVELNEDYPTNILMHPSDATAMELVKDTTTSQYVMPPFASINGTTIKGLPVRTSTLVPQGQVYVGNFNRFKVKIREDIQFEMGYRGAQGDWEKNMVSFLGEQRLFGFIPAVHYGSIVKIDLAVAKALLDPNVI